MAESGNENGKGVNVEFTIRHTIFAVAAFALISFFPLPSDKPGDWDEWVNTQANHFTADVVFDLYRVTHDPEKSQAIRGDYDTFDFVTKTDDGQFTRRTLVIGTDDLYSRGMRLLLLSALFLIICPPRSISKTRRFKKFFYAILIFHFLFLTRAFVMGTFVALFDGVPYIRTVDLPFRLLIIAFVLTVGLSTLDESPLEPPKEPLAAPAVRVLIPFLALACMVGGCKGSISNNSVTINAGGGSGYTPYIVVAVMIGWSYVKDIWRKRPVVRAQDNVKPWRKDGTVKRGADSKAADDAGDLI